MTSPFLYQPSPRFFHCAAQIGHKTFLWGGRTQNFTTSGRQKLASEIETFDVFHEKWETKRTTGLTPPGLYQGTCTTVAESIYHFGGYNGHSNHNSLHCLNSVTLEWTEIHSQTPGNQPMPKSHCGIVTYHNETLGVTSLAVFAGYGKPTTPTQPGSTFIQNTNLPGKGWTNEFHLFNLTNGEWSSPSTTRPRPPPCAGFSFTAINHHMVAMFGGNNQKQVFNDVYIIDFRSMEWTKLEKPEGAPWPTERSSHAATCLNYKDKHPQLLVTGGMDKRKKTLSDAWLLDINTGRWREVTLPECTQPRWGHTITTFNVCPGRTHTTTFGGSPKYEYHLGKSSDEHQKLAETNVMEFEPIEFPQSDDGSPTCEWALVGVIGSNQMRSEARKAELEKIKPRKIEHAGMDKMEVKNQQIQTESVKTVEQHVQAGSTAQQQVEQHVQAGSTAKQQGYLRGVEVIDHITFAYTGKAQSFEWLNRGFKIHFPENALPPGVDKCRVHIKASLSGQFDFSRDVELVSGLYWVSSRHVFTQPVTVEIQHCAQEDAQQQSRLTYIVASCSQEELPYQFKPLEGGVFSPSSRYGTINLTHFSGLAITSQPRPRQSLVQKFSRKVRHAHGKSYCSRLYYSSSGINSWEVFFVIMWDLELHIAAIDAKYTEVAARVGPDQEVMFEEEQITLDIPKEGLVLESGWTITPHTYPGVTKRQVDQFVPGRRVPSCQLYVKWTGQQEPPVELAHRVELLGAKEPFNFFLIRPPSLVTPQSPPQSPPSLQSARTEKPPIKPKLKDLMDALYHKVADKWKMIGLYLEIPKGKLAGIAENFQRDPHSCLVEMLETWLERVHPPATWAAIIEAVEFLGEEKLGEELREEYTP